MQARDIAFKWTETFMCAPVTSICICVCMYVCMYPQNTSSGPEVESLKTAVWPPPGSPLPTHRVRAISINLSASCLPLPGKDRCDRGPPRGASWRVKNKAVNSSTLRRGNRCFRSSYRGSHSCLLRGKNSSVSLKELVWKFTEWSQGDHHPTQREGADWPACGTAQ